MKPALKFLLLILSSLLILGGIIFYMRYQAQYPSTDDAYVNAHVVNISSQINGKVAQTFVHDHQLVHQGDLLFSLDDRLEKAQLSQAKAKRDQAYESLESSQVALQEASALVMQRKAELEQASRHSKRILSLTQKKLYSQDAGDDAIRQKQVAEAAFQAAIKNKEKIQKNLGQLGDQNSRIREALANLKQAKLNLSYTKVYAPASGYIANYQLRPGDTITAFQPIFALIDNQLWWVDANFKETQIQRIHPGQKARINLDMYPKHTFTGMVMSVSPGSGSSFSLLPSENASGNWIKVTQRFAVKIRILTDEHAPTLRLGASGRVRINTTNS